MRKREKRDMRVRKREKREMRVRKRERGVERVRKREAWVFGVNILVALRYFFFVYISYLASVFRTVI